MIDDAEIIRSPYDFPVQWVAMRMDEYLDDHRPMSRDDIAKATPDGYSIGYPTIAFEAVVFRYADAVLKSDPNPDKSDSAKADYRRQFRVTRLHRPGAGWDPRTIIQGPIVLAIAQGPFFAVALVLRAGGLFVQSLGADRTSIPIPTF